MPLDCDILSVEHIPEESNCPERRHYVKVWLALGANVGDRSATLKQATAEIGKIAGVRVVGVSGVYETPPWGYTNQPWFYNLALAIETVMAPLELLDITQRLEQILGRTEGPRWGPRQIDIDLILWDGLTVRHERVELPHPRFRERAFVLWPLREIAPGVVDPATGKSIAQLAAALEHSVDALRIRRLGALEQVS